MSNQDRISPYGINTMSSRLVRRIRETSVRGLLVDLRLNSLNQHYEKGMADSEENYS